MTAPKRQYSPRKTLFGLLFLAVLVFYPYVRAYFLPRHIEFSGETMGTFYTVKVANSRLSTRHLKALQGEVERRLDALNRGMSTYDPTSQISRFNASTNVTPIPVSPELGEVAAFALKLSRRSGGAFDPTVRPLVAAWGFYQQTNERIPDPETISDARDRVGAQFIQMPTLETLQKVRPDVSLDLNAVAKGFAVDEIANLLVAGGCPDVFVDIGGEIVTRGKSPQDTAWRIAIESPTPGFAPGEAEYIRVSLSGMSIASSGDYRNYFEDQGRTFSHILDPRTGWPVTNRVAATSVIAPDCMSADALATTLMVLDTDAGLSLIEDWPGAECLLIVRTPDGTFSDLRSSGWDAFVIAQ